MVPESAFASTGSVGAADSANVNDAVPTDFFFNAPFALELFFLGGENFVTALVLELL